MEYTPSMASNFVLVKKDGGGSGQGYVEIVIDSLEI